MQHPLKCQCVSVDRGAVWAAGLQSPRIVMPAAASSSVPSPWQPPLHPWIL